MRDTAFDGGATSPLKVDFGNADLGSSHFYGKSQSDLVS